MKFFKKKKSDKDLFKSFEPLDSNPVRAMASPVVVMPKPRKFLTPTRAILSRFDNDKTEVEEVTEEVDMIYPQKISPILSDEDEDNILKLLQQAQEEEASRALGSLSLAEQKLPVTKKKSFVMYESDDHDYHQSHSIQPHTLMPQFYEQQDIQQQLAQQQQQPMVIQQNNEHEQLLQSLRDQIEFMEQQRIKDKEEWRRKEQELLDNRQKMMETLQQTKEQLNQILRERDEAYQQQQEQEFIESPRQSPLPQLDVDRERTVNKSRSEEHLRTRSSSRSTYYEDYVPRKISYNDERPISRKSSSASTKSGYSPASTLVQRRRSRARSIDSKEQQQQMMMYMEEPPYYYEEDDQTRYRVRPEYYWQPPPVYYHTRQQPVDYNRRGRYPRHYSFN